MGDTMAEGKSNLLLRDFCPDIKDCHSQDAVHYSKFNHSLEDWHSYRELKESYLASREQQEGCFETDLRNEDASEEGCKTAEEGRKEVVMSSSEEVGEKEELP